MSHDQQTREPIRVYQSSPLERTGPTTSLVRSKLAGDPNLQVRPLRKFYKLSTRYSCMSLALLLIC